MTERSSLTVLEAAVAQLSGVVGLLPVSIGRVAQDQARASGLGAWDGLAQYGAIGIFVLVLGLAVRVLYNRAVEDLTYHRTRADRLEEELRALNTTIRNEYLATISKATEAISDAVAVLEPPKRGR
jgi:hypothetical protein